MIYQLHMGVSAIQHSSYCSKMEAINILINYCSIKVFNSAKKLRVKMVVALGMDHTIASYREYNIREGLSPICKLFLRMTKNL